MPLEGARTYVRSTYTTPTDRDPRRREDGACMGSQAARGGEVRRWADKVSIEHRRPPASAVRAISCTGDDMFTQLKPASGRQSSSSSTLTVKPATSCRLSLSSSSRLHRSSYNNSNNVSIEELRV